MSKKTLVMFLFFIGISSWVQAQEVRDSTQTYRIIKNDGAEYVGKIIEENAREVLLKTLSLGEIYIPKHEIKEIILLLSDGKSEEGEQFATRYYFSTNGFSLDDENYIIWNLFGPDIQINYKDKMGIGLITTWTGSPIIGSVKFSKAIDESTHLGYGSLLGTGSWSQLSVGGVLPYVSLTKGDAIKNLTFSAGYGLLWDQADVNGNALISVAAMNKTTNRISLVFDSFILYNSSQSDVFALIIPAIRVESEKKRAFQIGFAGTLFEGELFAFPLPLIQWFRNF